MTDSRSSHSDAVNAAIYAAGELQEILAIATDRRESLMGAILHAVGQTPFVESAQNAMNFCAELQNKIDEIFRLTEAISAELERYRGGF